jgi:hypothetical protein
VEELENSYAIEKVYIELLCNEILNPNLIYCLLSKRSEAMNIIECKFFSE